MASSGEVKKFGTFGGVYVPTILTVLGVIMYLRMGWIVGNAGIPRAVLILLIAQLITFITSLSMSSIATNMNMKAGGAYFMISRSFGVEAGAAIGIPLYLAQTIGIGLYIVGFSESFCALFPSSSPMIVGLTSLTVMSLLALISADSVVKIQYLILAAVVLSLVSVFAGGHPKVDLPVFTAGPRYLPGYGFWGVFAVFFPAVTGILSGVSMSGDLKNPQKSIPAGTLWAVLTGFLIYLALILWYGLTASPTELLEDTTIILRISRWKPLVYAGIWGATLSSAAASLLAAPRTMQALASDGILFRILKQGRGKNNEPVLATALTFLLTAGVILVGDLNTIAPVLTIFFLITYGSINLTAFIESLIGRPGFRPTLRVPWFLSLTGAASCIAVMFIINTPACLIGFGFVLLVYVLTVRKRMKQNWGDLRRGFWNTITRYALSKLERTHLHPQDWRPDILLFVRNNPTRQAMLHIAEALCTHRGFLSLISLVNPDENRPGDLEESRQELSDFLKTEDVPTFHAVAAAEDILEGRQLAVQVHGIGRYRPNMIMLEWAENNGQGNLFGESDLSRLFKTMHFYHRMNMSLLFYNEGESGPAKGPGKICVWWDPTQEHGSLMLMLAHLLASGEDWKSSEIFVKTVVLRENADTTRQLLDELVKRARIRAEIEICFPDDKESLTYQNSLQGPSLAGWLASAVPFLRKTVKNPLLTKPPAQKPAEDEEDRLKNDLADQVNPNAEKKLDLLAGEIIISHSQGMDLVLLGFNLPEKKEVKSYLKRMNRLLKKLPTTLLVNSPFDFDLFT